MASTTYTIANISKRSGVPIATIRSFENLGLLPHALRGLNYRAYAEDIAPRVRLIAGLFGVGFSVDEIALLLSLEHDAGIDRETVRRSAQRALNAAERRLLLLQALTEALTELSHAGLAHLRADTRALSARLAAAGVI